jgi:hypothetical protein
MADNYSAGDDDKLEALCEQWQSALRLKDWDVEVQVVRLKELKGKRGDIFYDVRKKDALIRVLDPRDEKAAGLRAPLDHEYTLVHELLHLHWAGIEAAVTDGPLLELIMEQAVHATANLLVQLLHAMKSAQATVAEHAAESTSAPKKRRTAAKQQAEDEA